MKKWLQRQDSTTLAILIIVVEFVILSLLFLAYLSGWSL